VDVGLELEGALLQNRYIFRSGERPIGRLYISFNPGQIAPDGRPVFQFEITARGKPESETLDSAVVFLRMAHKMAGSAFAAVIQPELKQIWGE
jgi:hypothetical protein